MRLDSPYIICKSTEINGQNINITKFSYAKKIASCFRSTIIKPEFEIETHFNDIAVIVLEDSFDTSVPHIGPILLPTDEDDEDFSLEGCFATGWGKDRFGRRGEYKTVLKQVQLNTVETKAKCQEQLRQTRLTQFFNLDKSFTCAGGEEGIDLCTGDGGGPLVCPRASNPRQFVQVRYKY